MVCHTARRFSQVLLFLPTVMRCLRNTNLQYIRAVHSLRCLLATAHCPLAGAPNLHADGSGGGWAGRSAGHYFRACISYFG